MNFCKKRSIVCLYQNAIGASAYFLFLSPVGCLCQAAVLRSYLPPERLQALPLLFSCYINGLPVTSAVPRALLLSLSAAVLVCYVIYCLVMPFAALLIKGGFWFQKPPHFKRIGYFGTCWTSFSLTRTIS